MKRARRTPPLDRGQHLRDARFILVATDGRHVRNLVAVCKEAPGRGVKLAISNPCFRAAGRHQLPR